MSYILYHNTFGPVAYIEAPAHRAALGENETAIPCEAGADVNDAERWHKAAALMRESGALAPTEDLARRELTARFTEAVQERLDSFARSGGKAYDNMFSLCSYATSSNPVFAAEGRYGVEARDATWAAAHKVLSAVLAGERATPSWAELEAELPVLEWPEVAEEVEISC